jgi:HSP20 family protein
MNLVRWNPTFEIERVFDELMRGTALASRNNGGNATLLPIDIKRGDKDVTVEASVPGFTPEEVRVTVDGGVLTISARREKSEETQDGDYLRQERYFGSLYRQISLGDGVDGDRAKADFKNGVLSVVIPLISKPEPKRIPVTAAAGK